MGKIVMLIMAAVLGLLSAAGQEVFSVRYYDEEDGLPHGHVTQLLQDEPGFLWLATWNGLVRFDGYEFRTFKSTPGDGCQMTTDRFRDIALRPDGRIVCRVDDSYYLFDPHTSRFRDMTADEALHAPDDLRRYRQSLSLKNLPDTLAAYLQCLPSMEASFALPDRQAGLWVLGENGLYRVMPGQRRTERLLIEPKAEVKCLFADSRQRYWVTTKDDAAVRVYSSADDRLLGFLGADGRLHPQYTPFGAAVYSMYESGDGTLWMGAKPGGLFRLREQRDAARPSSEATFRVERIDGVPPHGIYHIAEDCHGRLWIATLGSGLCYTDQPLADSLVLKTPMGYPRDAAQRVRYIHLLEQGTVLLAATTDGLVAARVEPDADDMRFTLYQRESDRAASLSSSATMDIATDAYGHLYVSTESGGINRLEDDRWTPADTALSFRHYNAGNHLLPSDVVLSMTPLRGDSLMVVGSYLVAFITGEGCYRQIDASYFNADYRLSDAHPLPLRDGRWLFGLTDGAFITSATQIFRQAYRPQVVLTGLSIQNGDYHPAQADDWSTVYADSLVLRPHERTVTIHFAALDLQAPERISYAFRLMPNERWNFVGRDRSATLLDLPPGTYRLEIRSTDAEGQWQDNVRGVTIVVLPTFWESAWGRTLMAVLMAAMLAVVVYTLLYIRRIKGERRETLEAYLALLNKPHTEAPARQEVPATPPPHVTPADDAMMKRIMAFVEQNIGNSDASVGDMADAAATSRSGLQRKLKQAMGITPQDLLREARLKHASLLLRTTDKTIAEVAYACGFSDPKYFSRCFKQSTGMSPSECRNAS